MYHVICITCVSALGSDPNSNYFFCSNKFSHRILSISHALEHEKAKIFVSSVSVDISVTRSNLRSVSIAFSIGISIYERDHNMSERTLNCTRINLYMLRYLLYLLLKFVKHKLLACSLNAFTRCDLQKVTDN
jgi:hypothetical protein